MKKNPIYFFIPPKEGSENSTKPGEMPAKEVNHYNTTIIHHHYPTSQLMDAPTIAKTAYSLIRPFFGKNKAISKITADITDAANTSLLELWEFIKPIFIEEFEKDDQLTEKAEKEDIAVHEIEKRIDKDAVLKSSLEQRLLAIEKEAGARGGTIIGSGNILNNGDISGVQGDIMFGGTKFK